MKAKIFYKLEDVVMTIGELCTFVGITRRQAMYWARHLGIVVEEHKWRKFTTTDIACLMLIKRLCFAGFTLNTAIEFAKKIREKMSKAIVE